MGFADLLRLIDKRSTAFRTAVASAADLDVPVPTCPDWTMRDLAQHLGNGQRRWAGIVTAGPADGPPAAADDVAPPPRDGEALRAWLAGSTEQLLTALRAAGPDRGCWTWWGVSQSPCTSGAVARHQVQEAAVHTYDAQLSLGAAQPLPAEVGLDGVGEFLDTCCAGPYAWPYEPCAVDYVASEGGAWRLTLTADGVRSTRLTSAGAPKADASLTGTAGELVLALYGRIPVTALTIDGDGRLFDQLLTWNPDD